MAKSQTQHVCQSCGRITAAYMGRCPQCKEFGTMVEEVLVKAESDSGRRSGRIRAVSKVQKISEIVADSSQRLAVPMEEFSRVLGGGLVTGSIVLLGGEPGIGKSTLLLQVADSVADRHGAVLYISGEESPTQIKLRANRLGTAGERLLVSSETNLEAIERLIEQQKPVMAVVDSIQTAFTDDLKSSPGSVSQVRECADRLRRLAKDLNISIILVGHVTKEGAIAGPKTMEHIVDTVLYLEGDQYHRFRLLRGAKNRFGPTSEIGVFEMDASGMRAVPNPSEVFLAERHVGVAGSAIAVTIEGNRPILVEIQALTSHTTFSQPRRTSIGVDFGRLILISAVLSRRLGYKLHDQDIFASVVGGIRIDEPAADLALAAAIASSLKDRPLRADTAFIGEVGLSGELRSASQTERRLKEAARLGFRRCIVPQSSISSIILSESGLEIVGCRSVRDAISASFTSS